MLSGKRFSRFLTAVLVLFVGVSLTLIVGILYGILSRTMTKEFYHRLQVQQAEVGMILQDRFKLLETKLQEMSLKNTVRVNLMLEDKSQMLELMEGILYETEFELYKSKDVNEGIRLAKTIKPDIILLDIMMPIMDGYMVSKVLKLNPETKDIPIIFLTAARVKEDIQKAIRAGGVDYIIKPFNASDLLTRLRKALGSPDDNESH